MQTTQTKWKEPLKKNECEKSIFIMNVQDYIACYVLYVFVIGCTDPEGGSC